jgi:hypothetical protein
VQDGSFCSEQISFRYLDQQERGAWTRREGLRYLDEQERGHGPIGDRGLDMWTNRREEHGPIGERSLDILASWRR